MTTRYTENRQHPTALFSIQSSFQEVLQLQKVLVLLSMQSILQRQSCDSRQQSVNSLTHIW